MPTDQEHDEFARLALRLRAAGATRVRAGAHEVVFAPLPEAPDTTPQRRVPMSADERVELEELRMEKARREALV